MSTLIRCNACNTTMALGETTERHILNGIFPRHQFCAKAMTFATWSELAIPQNGIKFEDLGYYTAGLEKGDK